jgi:hypothetical protein
MATDIFITADTAMATGMAVIIADAGYRPVVTSTKEFT